MAQARIDLGSLVALAELDVGGLVEKLGEQRGLGLCLAAQLLGQCLERHLELAAGKGLGAGH